jgi:hypothetical protein
MELFKRSKRRVIDRNTHVFPVPSQEVQYSHYADTTGTVA